MREFSPPPEAVSLVASGLYGPRPFERIGHGRSPSEVEDDYCAAHAA
jgi:hypothetical protein